MSIRSSAHLMIIPADVSDHSRVCSLALPFCAGAACEDVVVVGVGVVLVVGVVVGARVVANVGVVVAAAVVATIFWVVAFPASSFVSDAWVGAQTALLMFRNRGMCVSDSYDLWYIL